MSIKVFNSRQMPFPRLLLLMALLVLLGVAGCARTPTPSEIPSGPIITLEPCQLAAPGSSTRLSAKCGTLTVYEDRAALSGCQIMLYVAVIPALNRDPAPDPLFFITGGPGGAATQDYMSVQPAFQRINEDRDIVLVDQRGTGQSHPLDCPPSEDSPSSSDDDALEQEVTHCLNQLDADLDLYTTSIAMDDLDQVRAALGYDKINLYGVSYGTRAALTYLRQHEDHVRTVILDGVLPQDEPLGISVASDAQRALDLIFERCVADSACAQAFPNLRQEFKSLQESLEREPVAVRLPHPTTGEPTEVNFTQEQFAQTMRLFSYSQETVALLPLLIHTTQTSGDFGHLAAQHLLVIQQLEGNISEGMNHSVLCAEDAPFLYKEGEFAGNGDAEKQSYLGEWYRELENFCVLWPVTEVSVDFKAPVTSDVPVLLLSGEADPVTPPSNGDRAARTLPNSLHLVAPGQGHGVILRGCIPRIATEFIERGTVQELNTACISEIRPMPFFINFAGPSPEANEVKP
ncbi:MAG: alpha/beta hydrolase [Chloroflexota bacterium]|nr:alpha/beta hydrolase [Chloroflexota bacterium]